MRGLPQLEGEPAYPRPPCNHGCAARAVISACRKAGGHPGGSTAGPAAPEEGGVRALRRIPRPGSPDPLASRHPAPYLGRSEPGPQSAQGPPIGRKAPARSVQSGRALSVRPSPVTAEGRRRRRRGPRQRPTPKSPHRGPRTWEEETATAPECESRSRRRRRMPARLNIARPVVRPATEFARAQRGRNLCGSCGSGREGRAVSLGEIPMVLLLGGFLRAQDYSVTQATFESRCCLPEAVFTAVSKRCLIMSAL